jgi:hypothetical protein
MRRLALDEQAELDAVKERARKRRQELYAQQELHRTKTGAM